MTRTNVLNKLKRNENTDASTPGASSNNGRKARTGVLDKLTSGTAARRNVYGIDDGVWRNVQSYSDMIGGYDWRSRYEYDTLDPEDNRRRTQGLIPYALEKRYDLDDALDRALYHEGLPSSKDLSGVAEAATKERAKKEQERHEYERTLREYNRYSSARSEYDEMLSRVDDPEKRDEARELVEKYAKKAFKDANSDEGRAFYFIADKRREAERKAADEHIAKQQTARARQQSDTQIPLKESSPELYEEYAQTDMSGVESEIDELENRRIDLMRELYTLDRSGYQSSAASRLVGDELEADAATVVTADKRKTEIQDEISGINSRVKQLESSLAQMRVIQRAEETSAALREYDDITNAEDFEQYAAQGAETKADEFFNPSGQRHNLINRAGELDDTMLAVWRSNDAGGTVYTFMTDEERGIYNYLYAKQGASAADEYIKALEPVINMRWDANVQEGANRLADELPVISSALSVAAGIPKAAGAVKAVFTDDPYDPVYQAGTFQGAIRQNISSDLGDVGGFLYNTGMSILDTLAARGVGGKASLGIMGAGAMADTYRSALERGADPGQALAVGALAAISEAVFEKFSLDNWIKLKTGGRGKAVLNILRSMGVEASEEAATEVANILSDMAIMGELGETSGKSLGELAGQVGLAALGGGLSGGLFGGAGTAIGAYNNRQAQRALAAVEAEQNAPEAEQPAMQEAETAREPVEKLDELEKAEASGQIRNAPDTDVPDVERDALANDGQITPEDVSEAETAEQRPETQRPQRPVTPGLNRRASGVALQQAARRLAESSGQGVNDRTMREAAGAINSQLRAIDALAKRYGIEIELRDTIDAVDAEGNVVQSALSGHYDPQTRRIVIAADATDQAYTFVATHELVHYIKDSGAEGYAALESAVFDALEAAGQDVEGLIRQQMEQQGYDEISAHEEVIANSVPAILTDEATVRRIVETDRTLGEKIAEFFKKFAENLRSIFKSLAKRPDWTQMEAISRQADSMEKISSAFFGALEEAAVVERMESGAGDVKASPRLPADFGDTQDIEANFRTVANMKPVAELTGNEFPKGEKSLLNQVKEFFESVGGSVEHPELGTIRLTKSGIRNDIRHGIGNAKAVAFAAVPEVLKNGRVIEYNYDWKGRGYDTVTVSAPIKISGELNYMGAVLLKTRSDDVFYLHEIATENTPLFKTGAGDSARPTSKDVLSVEGASPFTTRPDDLSRDTSDDAPSVTSILQKVFDYKGQSQQDTSAGAGNVKPSVKEGADIKGGEAYVDANEATPRDILAGALLDTAQNQQERETIQAYQRAMRKINENQAGLDKAKTELRKMQFPDKGGKRASQAEIDAAQKKVAEFERYVNWWDSRLLGLESTKPLKDYVQRERARVAKTKAAQFRERSKQMAAEKREAVAAERKRQHEIRDRASAKRKETAEKNKHRARAYKTVNELYRWLTTPNEKQLKLVPEALRNATATLLKDVQFNRREWRENLSRLNSAMLRIDNAGFDGDAYMDVDPDLLIDIENIVEKYKDVASVTELDAEGMRELADALDRLKHMIQNANRFHQSERYEYISDVAAGTMRDLNGQEAKAHTGIVQAASNLFNVEQLDAQAYFHRLGKTAEEAVGKSVRGGLDKKIRLTDKAVKYMKGLLKGVDVKALSGRKAKLRTFSLAGGEVKMAPAQIMELYLLNKRTQAQGHLYNGGFKLTETVASENGKKTRVKMSAPVEVTPEDVKKITDTLTAEEKRIADDIQRFLGNECAAWGNDVSMTLYGYKKFTESNYYPIRSDSNYTPTQDADAGGKGGELYKLKNLGMTKATVQGANNPLIVGDIFDTFTRHVDEMASYSAFVVPLSNAMKWFNYRVRDNGRYGGSVKQSIEKAVGVKGKQYFIRLMKDINGASGSSHGLEFADRIISNAKAASVGANVRVVVQQPTAYLRAASEINPKYLAKGVFVKDGLRKALEYCPVALWKSWGFFDLNTGRSMRELIVGDQTGIQKTREAAIKLAQKADELTFGALWGACELEIRDTRRDLKPDTEAFNQAVGARLSEIIDKTQVVDTVLHRSQLMRNKDGLVKLYTSFMSEPTKSYNMIRTAFVEWHMNRDSKTFKRLARVLVTHTATTVATAAAAGLIDALRDDDEEKGWGEKFVEAFTGNTLEGVNPLGMIPVLRDINSLLSGYRASRMDMQAIERAVNAAESLYNTIRKGEPITYKQVYNTVVALSSITGIPVGNLMREFNGLYAAITGGSLME